MGGSGGRPKADIWKHVTILEGKRVKCKYCGLEFAESANRIKSHIYQTKKSGIRGCTKPPQLHNGSNERVDGNIESEGSPILGKPNHYTNLNKTMLDCYMSPKEMWEGMTLQRVEINRETEQHGMMKVGPFFVSTVVDARDLQLIKYVFDPSLDESESVFSSSHSWMNRLEFTTLKPESLLDSMIIDIFVEYLTDIERKKKSTTLNWYLPLKFSTYALRDDIYSVPKFVERQKMRENFMSKLVGCEKMFIPVHVDKKSCKHFYLYVLYLKTQEIEIWDSLRSFINEEERRDKTCRLLSALNILFTCDLWETNWRTFLNFREAMVNTPQQPNGYDCGIFVINFMQQSANLNRDPSFQFRSHEERLNLALKLLNSDLNKQREILYDKAAKQYFVPGGIKRKDIEAFKEFPDDSNKRVNNNVCLIGLQEKLDSPNSPCESAKGYTKGCLLPTTDLVGTQFQSYTEQILKWLMEDEVSVIGVWGMGGVGKTTLVTHIHNQLIERDNDFDYVIWVTVSQYSNINPMQKVIAKSINLDLSDEYEEKRMAGRLLHAFKQLNKCVLILDDAWDHVFLEKVGIPITDHRIKLILTTRLFEVCQSMNCKKNIIKVEPLSEDGAWDLFKKTLGNHGMLPNELEELAYDMIEKCDGLPHAILSIARNMKGKEDIREWQYELESNWQYNMKKWVYPILRSSYDHLNNKQLQECFLYFVFSGIPDKEVLIINYVFEGLIDGMKSLKAQYDEGYTILNKIKNNSLLEEFNGELELHKLVREMAHSIVTEIPEYMAKSYQYLKEIPNESEWKEDLQKVSLMNNEIAGIPEGTSPECPKLSTLLLGRNYTLKFITDDFFMGMPALKALDLSNTAITHLPKSISNLECLVALLLGGCVSLRYVPSLAKLRQLMWLYLCGTAITEVPPGLEMLINLRLLDLQMTRSLKMSTTSIIPKLTNLHSLHLNCIPKSMDVKARDLQGLKKLETISASFSDVKEFNDNVFSFAHSRCRLQNYVLTLRKMDKLDFDWIFPNLASEEDAVKAVVLEGMELGNMPEVLADINRPDIIEYHIRSLELGNLPVVLPEDIRWLHINDCHLRSSCLCHALVPVHFSQLQKIDICSCNNIKKLLTLELFVQLENLEIIIVEDCKSMKEIFSFRCAEEEKEDNMESNSGNHSKDEITLPKLRHVTLESLPELNFVYKGVLHCPSLCTLEIFECEKLLQPHILPALQKREVPDGYELYKE